MRMRYITATLFTILAAAGQVHAFGPPPPPPPMVVIVDMDASTPGIQSSVQVTSCATAVNGIAIYIYDPYQAYYVWSIGYLGGIDRGIAFGHTTDNANIGAVTQIDGTPGTPVNPGNTPWVEPGFIPVFDGGEVHYLEWGAAQPSQMATQPLNPVCTINVSLSNARPGDRFRFYLLDYVSVWSGGTHGAFSVSAAVNSLDAGGDYVSDGTDTMQGIDPDHAIASPPAPFLVDYIDGPVTGGGAIIEIVPRIGDINSDGSVNVGDLLSVINSWGRCPVPPAPCAADIDHSLTVDVYDLILVLNNWGGCN